MKKMEQVAHSDLCSVFNLILGGTAFLHQNAFRKHRIHEMKGQKNQSGHPVISWQVRSPVQIQGIRTDVSSTHNVSIVKLKIKRRKISYKQKAGMNNQSQNGIRKNTCGKLQRKTLNRSEAVDGSTDWKQVKMEAS